MAITVKLLLLTLLLSAPALSAAEPEPEKFIREKVRERRLVWAPESAMYCMDVLDKDETGALVQLFTRREEFNGYRMVEREILAHKALVLGLGNGVGSRVSSSLIYDLKREEKFKGTLYKVFSVEAPESKYETVEVNTQVPNPAWEVWNQQRQAEARAATAAAAQMRLMAYKHQQASNGLVSYQVELGRLYLNGSGVATNVELARHWLFSACTNGSSEASNLLSRLPK